jgi:hypothetical protein
VFTKKINVTMSTEHTKQYFYMSCTGVKLGFSTHGMNTDEGIREQMLRRQK